MSQIEARVGAAAPSATMVSSHRMLRLRDWITGIGICALAIGLTAYQLGARPLWNDEAWTAWIGLSVVDFHGLLNQIQVRAFNMSLYYAIIFAWVHFWGAHGVLSTEWIVRLPSLVFAALSAVAVWLIGRRFLGGFAGALGAVLYVCNIAQLDAAQQARSYPLLLLLVCLSWYALLVLVSSPSSQLWWVVYVVTNVLANYAHILNALDIMAQAAAFGLFLSLDTVWRARTRPMEGHAAQLSGHRCPGHTTPLADGASEQSERLPRIAACVRSSASVRRLCGRQQLGCAGLGRALRARRTGGSIVRSVPTDDASAWQVAEPAWRAGSRARGSARRGAAGGRAGMLAPGFCLPGVCDRA